MALEAADLDGLAMLLVQDAGAFAEHLYGADPRAARAQNI
jgi:hypothetical protein